MSRFDPAHERSMLLGECGYEFDLAADIDQARVIGGRGSSAHAFLGTAIRCILTGLPEPATRLLSKAEQWVTLALADSEMPKRYRFDERYSPEGEAAFRYQTLALCKWLLHDQHDAECYRRFVELEDHFLARSKVGKDKVSISLILPVYVDAGSYSRALQLFATTSGLKPPTSLRSIRNEVQMSYVLCRHRVDLEYSETEVATAARAFLNRQMGGWLGSGHFVRAAEWSKIVYWQEGKAGLAASAALLKCYEHLRVKFK